MIKPEWGTKHHCSQCGASFFDLKRKPPTCPKCGEAVKEGKPKKARRSAPPPEVKPEIKAPVDVVQEDGVDEKASGDTPQSDDEPAKADNGGEDELEPVEGGEEDDGVIEDASDIGENDDDLSEVLEHVDEGVADNT